MPIDDSEALNPPALAADVPQFATAEYNHIPSSERCGFCDSFLSGEYYRVNNRMACSTCGLQARQGQPKDSHAAFVSGLTLGAGAALLGMILYATFTIVTHFYLGYIALGVGWLVGVAIMKGSNGTGGLRYQIAAVVLTYAAISVAAVPILLAALVMHGQDVLSVLNSGGFLLRLLFVGLASPLLQFHNPISGVIRLVILFVGLRIAFRITRAKPLSVDGPYPVTS
jgi:hypothetical protein